MFGHIQDGGEAGDEAVDKRRCAFWVAGQPRQRVQRLGALFDRQLVYTKKQQTTRFMSFTVYLYAYLSAYT